MERSSRDRAWDRRGGRDRSGARGATGDLRRGFERRLSAAVAGSLSKSIEDRICYSFDATDLRSLPDIVVWPAGGREVSAVVRLAAEEGVPVVPRGAGTGYTGGSLPVSGGIVLSFEKMNRIVSIDAGRGIAVVEPGVVNQALRDEVEALGLSYPPDPASLKVSSLGGNVAEGAGGPRTVLYGTTRDYVVGLEVVLPDGTTLSTGFLASCSGWDPGPLIVGSEGTLAIITKIALRLTALPSGFATYWVEFPSLDAAAAAVVAISAAGLPVSVLEILDHDTAACALEHVRGYPEERVPEAALLIEIEGNASEIEQAARRLRACLIESGASAVREAGSEAERDEIWEIRRSISPSLAKLSTGKINEDITVPRSAIPAFVRAMHEISGSLGLPILAFGHAGDGNLHVNVIVDREDAGAMARARDAVSRLFSTALAMGGTLSGEHGIGITKADHLAEELSPTALAVTASVKRAFDPAGLLNPDKILTDRGNPWWKDLPPEPAPAAEGGQC